MKILITGATGLIGRALQTNLTEKGHELLLAGRREPENLNQIRWDIEAGFDQPKRLEGVDAVIHLAGENIGALRWTEAKKRAIRDSRILGTRSVVEALSKLDRPPNVLISASGIIYGNRGGEILTEDSPPGTTFLSKLVRDWEDAADKASEKGIRVAKLRIGPVLAKDGGALESMSTPFSLGLGGIIGNGGQWMSWVALDDVIAVIGFVLENDSLVGSLNVVSPNPVTNREFTKTLGGVINRPTIVPLPEFAVKLMFGEMGEELLLSSARVIPKRLIEAGYEFKFTNLKPALENALK